MTDHEPNRLAEWFQLLRSQIPDLRQRLAEWWAAVREQPLLLWETPAIRCSAYGLGALVLFWTITGVTNMLAPPPTAVLPPATTGDFHVVCSNATCGHHFVVHRKLGFRAFPVRCPNCERDTGIQGRRCNSKRCRGAWVAPQKRETGLHCPVCGGRLE